MPSAAEELAGASPRRGLRGRAELGGSHTAASSGTLLSWEEDEGAPRALSVPSGCSPCCNSSLFYICKRPEQQTVLSLQLQTAVYRDLSRIPVWEAELSFLSAGLALALLLVLE